MPSATVKTGAHGFSVPEEAKALFWDGVLRNPLISRFLPKGIEKAAELVQFYGSEKPTLPVNWRIAESACALHALEASLIGLLLEKKYKTPAPVVKIEIDHAQLFCMSLFLWTLDPGGDAIAATAKTPKLFKYIRNQDLHRRATTPHRAATSGIYKCADGKYFHTHGSMNPDPVLDMLGLPYDLDTPKSHCARKSFEERISRMNSMDLLRATEKSGQAGHLCNSVEEYLNSEHGQANAHVGLFEIKHNANQAQPPTWWPSTDQTSPARPLAGLKVVDLTRVIAGPSVTRGLAELGASVMRVTSPNVADWAALLHIDTNWGKWNADIDLKTDQGRQQLKELIRDADVVVNGYRPGALDKHGLSDNDILELTAKRPRGLVLVRENCYGWHGPYKHRPGWQPTADACTGVEHGYGRALGLDDEPVTPLFPNSDYCTGIAGVAAVLSALIHRGEKGGSYTVDLAICYYNQWLIKSCGAYPDAIWEEMYEKYGCFKLRASDEMEKSAPIAMQLMGERSNAFKDEYFELRRSEILNVDVRRLKPVLQYPDGEVRLGFNVGTRGNGRDAPRWPQDLMMEIVE